MLKTIEPFDKFTKRQNIFSSNDKEYFRAEYKSEIDGQKYITIIEATQEG